MSSRSGRCSRNSKISISNRDVSEDRSGGADVPQIIDTRGLECPQEEQSSTCVFLTDAGIGSGPDELRVALMKAFISTLKKMSPLPSSIVFITNGVKLICSGSPVIEELEYLESAGVSMLACGTCLDYLGLMDKVKTGKVSNMYEIAGTLLRAGNVVRM